MSGISYLLDLVDLPCGGGWFINQRISLHKSSYTVPSGHNNDHCGSFNGLASFLAAFLSRASSLCTNSSFRARIRWCSCARRLMPWILRGMPSLTACSCLATESWTSVTLQAQGLIGDGRPGLEHPQHSCSCQVPIKFAVDREQGKLDGW